MRDNILELKDIFFAYGDGPAVIDGLDFSLASNQKIGIIGPNGSGKTTLFHIIMGLLPGFSGQITAFGRPIVKGDDFTYIRRHVGFLFQNSDDQLFCPTVLDDVAFGPLNLGKTGEETLNIVKDTLKRLGISGFEKKVTHKLSHGEKKIVALASVLAMDPRVLILDEPAAGLDHDTKDRLKSILEDIDLSCIITSHDMDFLHNATERVYAINQGRIDMSREVVLHTHVHMHQGGAYEHTHNSLIQD